MRSLFLVAIMASCCVGDQLTVEIHIPCPNTPTPPFPSSTIEDGQSWESLTVMVGQQGVGFWEEEVSSFTTEIGYTQVVVDVTGMDWMQDYDVYVSGDEVFQDEEDRWWDVSATAFETEDAGKTDPVIDVYPGLDLVYGRGTNIGSIQREARRKAALFLARKVIWDAKQLLKRVTE